MPLDVALARRCLKDSDFNSLFIEGLGWDRYTSHLDVTVDDRTHSLSAVAQKRGMVAFVWQPPSGGRIPDYPTRRKVERKVAKSVHEHLIVYVDGARTTQVWQWVKREAGKPTACREHTYHRIQPGDALIQKLQALAFSIEDEEGLTLFAVTSGVRAGFDVEKVTKRFYDRFKTEHAAFTKFLKGIPDEGLQRWYVSVMLNRLMFIYFVQKKGFLDGDADYLRNKLAASRDRGKDRYYRDFLCHLFFEGFAKRPQDRSAATNRLLGQVPYLNGGLFLKHQIEEQHGRTIEIPDRAFEKIFAFFDAYRWHLDERPLRRDDEINPDVLGYIFEKYINQKQMGAYYTKEDITGYISQNTVIPRLFDMARAKCKVAFEGDQAVWRLLAADPDRYIYEPVRRGVIAEDGSIVPEKDLPDFVQKGMHDPKARLFDKRYNLGKAHIPPLPSAGEGGVRGETDGPNLALPTETWREYVERRKRCLDLRRKIAAGEVHEINDLITLNLDIRQFAQDVVENAEGPDLLVAFWNAIQGITVLDPACGSGAFLFAALNILEPLYEACLDRMTAFLDEWGKASRKRHPNYTKLFTETLGRVTEHPNRRYFVLKSIVIQNLYGVDIMDEAVEICKLRLFLKLVAQVDDPDRIEPLPDIDFNIRSGNTLVGFATRESVREALAKETSGQQKMVYGDEAEALKHIEEKAGDVDRHFGDFRDQQTKYGGIVTAADKETLRKRLRALDDELNRYLAAEYAVEPAKAAEYQRWLKSHQPFHWFVEFYGIMKNGGFDAIIGNPPYVASAKVRKSYIVKGYRTERCTDIYAWFLERVSQIAAENAYTGMIVPLSLTFSGDFAPLRTLLYAAYQSNWFSSFGRIPSALFAHDVRVRNTIHLGAKRSAGGHFTTRLHRWFDSERPNLFSVMSYAPFKPARWAGRVPKLNTGALIEAFEAAFARGKTLDSFFGGSSKHRLYFKKTAYNWLNFCRKMPPCYDENGGSIPHTKFGEVYFAKGDHLEAALLLLNGKLQLAFWIAIGDDFDVTKWMFGEFPVDLDRLPNKDRAKLSDLASTLEAAMKEETSFKLNAGKRVGNYNLARCRPITDESDQILARVFGFEDVWEDIQLLYTQFVRTDFSDEPPEEADE